MDPSTYRGLTFLLSLGALPIACNPEKNDTTDGGTGGTTTGTTTGTTGDESSSNVVSDSGPTEGTSGVTTSGGTSTGETGGTDGACASYIAFSVMCDASLAGMEAQLLAECEADRKRTAAARGDACLALSDALRACLGMSADCADPTACKAEEMAESACLPEPGEACKAYAAKYVECVPGEDPGYIAGLCQSGINYSAYDFGPACGAATEDYYVCLGGLSCNAFKMGTGCDAQVMMLDTLCM